MIPDAPDYLDKQSEWFGDIVKVLRARCELCEDHSGVRMGTDGVATECDCTALAKKCLLLKRGNVPKDYWSKPKFSIRQTLPSFVEMEAQVKAGRGVLLYGPNGSGKTTTAIELLRLFVTEMQPVFRIEANEMVRAMVLATRGMKWTDLWLQEGMFKACVSVDEMGSEFAKSFFGQEARINLGYFVKHRAEQGMPSILCTNLSPDEFNETYGDTVASVINGHRFASYPLSAEDWRSKLGD